jgi:hypothetical protein
VWGVDSRLTYVCSAIWRPIFCLCSYCILQVVRRIIASTIMFILCTILTWKVRIPNFFLSLIQPPRTGGYTFYVSGDDQCRLSISTDHTRKNLQMVVMFPKGLATGRFQWTKYVDFLFLLTVLH